MSGKIDASNIAATTTRTTPRAPRTVDVTDQFLRIFERRAEIEMRILTFMGGATLGVIYGVVATLAAHR